jgi:hypothetical protein
MTAIKKARNRVQGLTFLPAIPHQRLVCFGVMDPWFAGSVQKPALNSQLFTAQIIQYPESYRQQIFTFYS